jgi:NADH-quinone oxidoreductase subunit N
MQADLLANDLIANAPLLILGLGSLVVLLGDLFAKKSIAHYLTQITLIIALFFAFKAICPSCHDTGVKATSSFLNTMFNDRLANLVNLLLIAGTLLVSTFSGKKLSEAGIDSESEYNSLLLISTAGAIVFANASEFITMFIGLETMSMALYCLCASAVQRPTATESGLKYFLLGSFSSAFLLYGMVLLYGLSGSTYYSEITVAINSLAGSTEPAILAFAIGLLIIGLVFKIGLVPFQFWAPDVYQGAPTAVTAYMSCVIKAAAVIASLRVILGVFADSISIWSPAIWLMAVLTLVFANLVALRQRSLKRLLAYSSIGHAGYIAMAFLTPANQGATAAIFYYLVAYTLMTIGAFTVLFLFSSSDQPEADDISNLNGFASNNPFLAAVFSLFLLALAGLPPGMAGMLGKFYIFNSAIKAGYVGLAIIAVLCAAVSCYYYLRVIVAMYFIESDKEVRTVEVSSEAYLVLLVCASLVVILGICPSIVYNLL